MPFGIGATGGARTVICTQNLHLRSGQGLGRAQGKCLNENLPIGKFPREAHVSELRDHLCAAGRTIVTHAFDGYKQRPGLVTAQQLIPCEFLFHRLIHRRFGLEHTIAHLGAGDEIEAQRFSLPPNPFS